MSAITKLSFKDEVKAIAITLAIVGIPLAFVVTYVAAIIK